MKATPTFEAHDSRVLVVGRGRCLDAAWVARIRERFSELRVAQADSYLEAIAELSARPAQAVFVDVDPTRNQLDNAVGGLREAAGRDARLVLCCTPDAEPAARRAARCGADDYFVWPMKDDEIAAVLGRGAATFETVDSTCSMAELADVAVLVGALGEKPRALLDAVAALVRRALSAPGVMLVVEGAAATCGERVIRPVLTAALPAETGVRGQIALSERPDRPYSVGDAEKLRQYAQLIGSLLAAAARERQLRKLASTDECSGLPNRRFLNEQLRAILDRAADERFSVTVLLFDLDDFKSYNDRFGHHAGDEIIRVIGRLFRQHSREQDVIARYGGDEFAVVFWDSEGPRAPGSRHPGSALAVLDRFTAALKTEQFPSLGPTGQGTLTISGGLATYPWDAATPDALLQRADEALLVAKRAGKNRIYLIGDPQPR